MEEKIGIVGLGYVGLPLACIFADQFEVVGLDKDSDRVAELKSGHDHTLEVTSADLQKPNLSFTDNPEDLGRCSFIIVAVPTPIDDNMEPDLRPVHGATKTIAQILKPGMMVVFESTVYPGVTEEECLPILEDVSGLKLGDFDLGYSPERVNPGDKEHTIDKILKIVSGHSQESLKRAAGVYGAIITAGIHQAPTIKTAEAAKVIENVQRDLNIALMNELSKIFALMDIHTPDVIAAAGTKWNFHKYHPGLVGGHCIGVDPYYLTRRALDLGYHPEVILSGRKINDGMGEYVSDIMLAELAKAGKPADGAQVLVMGLTFKEDVPDFRNTRATDVIQALEKAGVQIKVWEPLVEPEVITEKFKLSPASLEECDALDGVVLVNAHKAFSDVTLSDLAAKMEKPILVDVKNFFDGDAARELGMAYRSL